MIARLLGVLIGLCLTAVPSSVDALAEPAAALPEAPKAVKRISPRYPERALLKELAGDAELNLTVTAAGEPTDIVIVDEAPAGFGFGQAALESVEPWRFELGKPGRYHLIVRFRIENVMRVILDSEIPSAPEPTGWVAPIYPPLALRRGIEGTVTVVVQMEEGDVKGVGVGRRDPKMSDNESALFGDAAALAVLKWKFPETANGIFSVSVHFSPAELAAGRIARHKLDK